MFEFEDEQNNNDTNNSTDKIDASDIMKELEQEDKSSDEQNTQNNINNNSTAQTNKTNYTEEYIAKDSKQTEQKDLVAETIQDFSQSNTTEQTNTTAPDKDDIDNYSGIDGFKQQRSISPLELEATYGVNVKMSIMLGKSSITVKKLLSLKKEDLINLDRKVGEAVDIYINNRLVARGELIVLKDKLGITMTEIIKSDINNMQELD